MRVYLAGPIRGKSYGEATDWRDDIIEFLAQHGHIGVSPMRGKEHLKKLRKITRAYEEFPLSSSKGIYGRDRFDVAACEVLLANLLEAEAGISIGTVMEIQRAYDFNRYVLTIVGKKSPYDHPFVQEASSLVVPTLEEAKEVLLVLGEPYAR